MNLYNYHLERYGRGITSLPNGSYVNVDRYRIMFVILNSTNRIRSYITHRLDGPAIVNKNGTTEWWINGKNVTKDFITWAIENNIDIYNLTDEDINMIKLIWT